MNRAFGMIPSGDDPRDIIYSGSHVGGAPSIPDKYSLPNPPMVLDQGSTPMCAAVSIASIMEWQSMAKDPSNKGRVYDPYQIFNLREDKSMQGMIPREALKSVKNTGVGGNKIDEFAKITNFELLKMSILCNGPVMIGTYAYENPIYFWRPEGKLQGGHAVVLLGWEEKGYILQNSWGFNYGESGRIIMPFEDEKYVLEAWTIIM